MYRFKNDEIQYAFTLQLVIYQNVEKYDINVDPEPEDAI
jgi:hypothetical protein